MYKKVFANTASQIIGKIIGAFSTLVITIIVARQFGVQGYGDFVKITTFVSIFYLLVDFGINAIFLQKDEHTHWSSFVSLRLVMAVGFMFLACLIVLTLPGIGSHGYPPVVKLAIIMFTPTIFLQSIITTANAIFQKKLRYEFATVAIFFGSLITIILLIKPASLLMVLVALVIGTGITALLSFVFANRLLGKISNEITISQIKSLLVPALPLGVTLLFNLVYFRADSIIITLSRPTQEVGIYGLAYKVFEVLLVFPTFFMNAVYPFMLQNQNIKKIIYKSGLILFCISIVSLVLFWVAAPLLSFIKSEFVPSIGALRVLLLGLPFYFVSSVLMWGLITKKKQGALMVIYGIAMLVNIIGNIFLVPTYGYIAAAWMTIVGEAIIVAMSGIALKKLL